MLSFIYFLFNPIEKIQTIFIPENLVNIILISGTYAIGHYCWYNSMKNIDLALSSSIQALQPIITSVLAFFILQEQFTVYHLIGLIVITSSILIIFYDKNKVSKRLGSPIVLN